MILQRSRATVRGYINTATAWLDNTLVLGRSVRWYVTGWPFGLVIFLLAIIAPSFLDQPTLTSAISICIYAMLALGLNIVVGYAGLLDLGYVAFFVIGSYTVAVGTGSELYNSNGQPFSIPTVSFWLLLPLAAVIAALFGILLGAPTLRLRGDYLAIVTLGFGEIVPKVFQNVPYFNGSLGMGAAPPPDINLPLIGDISFSDPLNLTPFYYLALGLLAIVVVAVIALRDSSIGRAWIAIREDETAAAASGVNLVRTKLLAFGLGALIGGIGGALNTAFLPVVNPNDFNFGISITVLAMIVLGGIGSIPGVILGATILRYFDVSLVNQISTYVQENPAITNAIPGLNDINEAKLLIYGMVLVLMILLRPQGLLPNRRRSRELKGIGASAEGTSAVGLLAREESGLDVPEEDALDETAYTGAGSDARGRE